MIVPCSLHEGTRCESLCRKGLIRTAIETGTPVVPCYHLGNSQTLRFGPAWLKPVSRRLRTSIGIVMGWMGTPLPVSVPIYMCVGERLIPGVCDTRVIRALADATVEYSFVMHQHFVLSVEEKGFL